MSFSRQTLHALFLNFIHTKRSGFVTFKYIPSYTESFWIIIHFTPSILCTCMCVDVCKLYSMHNYAFNISSRYCVYHGFEHYRCSAESVCHLIKPNLMLHLVAWLMEDILEQLLVILDKCPSWWRCVRNNRIQSSSVVCTFDRGLSWLALFMLLFSHFNKFTKVYNYPHFVPNFSILW